MDLNQKTPNEIIQILPQDEQLKAIEFISLGESLDCKWQTRYAKANKYWRCVFSKKKSSRVLFTVECTNDWWRIKVMLSNLERYKEKLNDCSSNLIEKIKTAYDCYNCNKHCKGPNPFTIDDVEYKKCLGCSFYFQDLDGVDQESLISLIKNENHF